MNLTELSQSVSEEFSVFEKRFSECMPFGEDTIGALSQHVLSQKGKRIRPLVSFLVAKACGGLKEATYRATIILELLHTASLVHDDVLDESELRRGNPTVNKLWGNKTAILFGDYIYGKCLHLIETQEDFDLLPIYSKIARELPQGELLQKDLSESLSFEKESYFEVIDRKTASLFGASAYVGAKTANSNEDYSLAAESFGRLLGRAFQIKDDILDFDLSNKTGKGHGNDIKERKMTLPLILMIESLGENDRKRLLDFMACEEKSDESVRSLVAALNETNCLQKAEDSVRYYSAMAKEQLAVLPNGEYRTRLEQLADCLVSREL